MKKPIRHGEIMLKAVENMPDGKIEKRATYIVGHSESGHHHVLESTKEFEVLDTDEELYLRLFEPAKIVHKKTFNIHEPLTISPGIYKRYYDTEYDPFDQRIRKAVD